MKYRELFFSAWDGKVICMQSTHPHNDIDLHSSIHILLICHLINISIRNWGQWENGRADKYDFAPFASVFIENRLIGISFLVYKK